MSPRDFKYSLIEKSFTRHTMPITVYDVMGFRVQRHAEASPQSILEHCLPSAALQKCFPINFQVPPSLQLRATTNLPFIPTDILFWNSETPGVVQRTSLWQASFMWQNGFKT